jgi:hypothetical protein
LGRHEADSDESLAETERSPLHLLLRSSCGSYGCRLRDNQAPGTNVLSGQSRGGGGHRRNSHVDCAGRDDNHGPRRVHFDHRRRVVNIGSGRVHFDIGSWWVDLDLPSGWVCIDVSTWWVDFDVSPWWVDFDVGSWWVDFDLPSGWVFVESGWVDVDLAGE